MQALLIQRLAYSPVRRNKFPVFERQKAAATITLINRNMFAPAGHFKDLGVGYIQAVNQKIFCHYGIVTSRCRIFITKWKSAVLKFYSFFLMNYKLCKLLVKFVLIKYNSKGINILEEKI